MILGGLILFLLETNLEFGRIILEDAFNQLNVLLEDDLQGLISISFVNEFGVEEVGIDGGGIFKDFMENIT